MGTIAASRYGLPVVAATLLIAACSSEGDESGSTHATTATGTGTATASGTGAGAGGSAAGGGTSTGTGSQGGAGGGVVPTVAGCPVFTADDEWNRDVTGDPVDADWTSKVLALAGDIHLHPDLGNWQTEHYGIPINAVPSAQPAVPVTFDSWPGESDPGPYPFPDPSEAEVEGGDPYSLTGDNHLLVVQQGSCKLYEGFACYHDSGWHCANGAVWDLTLLSYGQRPIGWTSADAAGLPIMPGLARYDEVQSGEIRHAIRFTMSCSRANYVAPATHYAVPQSCGTDPDYPPMGLRVRLQASYDVSGFNPTAQVILRAMKRYGLILADNGSDFYFQGEMHLGWNDDLDALKQVPVDAFEALVPGPLGP